MLPKRCHWMLGCVVLLLRILQECLRNAGGDSTTTETDRNGFDNISKDVSGMLWALCGNSSKAFQELWDLCKSATRLLPEDFSNTFCCWTLSVPALDQVTAGSTCLRFGGCLGKWSRLGGSTFSDRWQAGAHFLVAWEISSFVYLLYESFDENENSVTINNKSHGLSSVILDTNYSICFESIFRILRVKPFTDLASTRNFLKQQCFNQSYAVSWEVLV